MKITPLTAIIVSFLLLSGCKCNKDKDEFYFQAKVNGAHWTATTTDVATPLGIITQITATSQNGDIISLKLPAPVAGTYPFREWDATLISFTVVPDGQKLNIDWETTAEVNTSHFVIERSTDGATWSEYHTEPAAGTAHSYHVELNTSFMSHPLKYYYRLKLVDDDSSFTYSPIKMVTTEFVAFYHPAGKEARTGHSGILRIHSIDESKRIISGEFEFESMIVDPGAQIGLDCDITEGKFRIQY